MMTNEKQLRQELKKVKAKLATAETTIATSANRDKLARQCSNIGFWDLITSTGDVQWSPEILPLLSGIPSDDMDTTFENFLTFVHPEDREETNLTMVNAIKEHKPFRSEYRVIHQNGEIHWLLGWGRQVVDENGLEHIFGALMDITERVKTETDLKQARREAESSNQAKSIFLTKMSHEIRTPMNAILGFAQIIKRDTQLSPKSKKNISTIISSGDHLLALINDILEMSKIEAGRIVLSPGPFDLMDFLREVELMFQICASEKRLSLEMVIDDDVPQFILADEGKLRQVLVNLLGNAVKFTNEGGILVRVTTIKAETIQLVFEVIDSGIGIGEKDIDSVFEAFEQVTDDKKTLAQGGTGLGLPISREYARFMGGDLTVSSRHGNGTTFRLNVRVEETNKTVAVKLANKSRVIGLAPGQAPYRILVADDMETNRDFLLQLLGPIGFKIDEAENGEKAVESFKANKQDLILIDVRMPIMDGIEATKLIRQLPEGKNTPIITVTAHAFEDEKVEIMESGTNEILHKPLQEKILFEVLKNHLGVKYLYDELDKGDTENRDGLPDFIAADAMALLPPKHVTQMCEAIKLGDYKQLQILIDELDPAHENIAQTLHSLAAHYDYYKLIELFEPKDVMNV